jgi:hypothetical protein
MRARWAELTNEHLREHGIAARVDHRSLAAQGIDRVPTTHLGVAVWGMERRGIDTQVAARVRAQRELEAQQRLERAAELGRLEREGASLSRSILDLSADLAAARAARGHEVPGKDQRRTTDALEGARDAAARWKEQRAQHASPSIEELQRQGREAWLKLRREQLEREKTKGQERGLEPEREQEAKKSKDRELDRDIGDDFGR